MIDIKQSLLQLVNTLHKVASDEKDVIQQINLYGLLSSFLCLNYSKTFSSPELEQNLTTISEQVIFDVNSEFDENHILHVMTEAYLVGGHTRVVDNWIKGDDRKHSVFINSPSSLVPDFLIETVRGSKGTVILNEKLDMIDKARYLSKEASKYKYIVLHHHPDDLLPLLAFGTKKFTRPIFLYNHADYIWGCGYTIADYILELSNNHIDFSCKCRGIPPGRAIYFGIPIKMETFIPNKKNKLNDHKRVACMARASKFIPILNYNFPELLIKLLDKHKNVVIDIIGSNGEEEFWQKIKHDYPLSINFYGELSKCEAHNVLERANLYIDSLPIGSGTSFLEAITLGVPALSVQTPLQNMDGYKHISCANTLELLTRASDLLNKSDVELDTIAEQNFIKIKSWYGLDGFMQRVKELDVYSIRNPLGYLLEVENSNYINNFCEFMFASHEQNQLKFNFARYSQLNYRNKQRVMLSILENGLQPYSEHIWNNDNILEINEQYLATQLFIVSQNGQLDLENHQVTKFKLSSDIYEYDLTKYASIELLRLYPLNSLCKIILKHSYIIDEKGKIYDVIIESHNGHNDGFQQQYIVFAHYYPIIVFKMPQNLKRANKFVIDLEISPLSSSELNTEIVQLSANCDRKDQELHTKNQELDGKNQELKNKDEQIGNLSTMLAEKEQKLCTTIHGYEKISKTLADILNSRTWRSTEPIRRAMQFFRNKLN